MMICEELDIIKPIRVISYSSPIRFVEDLYKMWNEIVSEPGKPSELVFDLWGEQEKDKLEKDESVNNDSKLHWIHINCLVHIMTVIDAFKVYDWPIKVQVRLFPLNIVKEILESSSSSNKLTFDLVKSIREQLIFYNVCEFPDLLNSREVQMQPSLSYFNDLSKKLKVNIQRDYERSSTMMPLSALVDNPIDNTNLAERLENVKNILRNQVYQSGPKDDSVRRSEVASTLFMFELVKNIYQHAFEEIKLDSPVRGYATAQVVHFPTAKKAQKQMKTFAELIGIKVISNNDIENKIRFLTICISDFGTGIVAKVRKDLENSLNIINKYKSRLANIDDKSKLDLYISDKRKNKCRYCCTPYNGMYYAIYKQNVYKSA